MLPAAEVNVPQVENSESGRNSVRSEKEIESSELNKESRPDPLVEDEIMAELSGGECESEGTIRPVGAEPENSAVSSARPVEAIRANLAADDDKDSNSPSAVDTAVVDTDKESSLLSDSEV